MQVVRRLRPWTRAARPRPGHAGSALTAKAGLKKSEGGRRSLLCGLGVWTWSSTVELPSWRRYGPIRRCGLPAGKTALLPARAIFSERRGRHNFIAIPVVRGETNGKLNGEKSTSFSYEKACLEGFWRDGNFSRAGRVENFIRKAHRDRERAAWNLYTFYILFLLLQDKGRQVGLSADCTFLSVISFEPAVDHVATDRSVSPNLGPPSQPPFS